MGFLKRIFGSGTKQTDEQVKQDLEKITTGQVNKIYPILKPGDWVGLKVGALHKVLLGTQEEPRLVLGYGYDAPGNFIFLTQQDLEKLSEDEIAKQAAQNLKECTSEFTPVQALGGKVLTASGQDFSSEKILSESFMRKAHALLGSDELLVSIPRRRCMMVTSRQADQELLSTFIQLHQVAWEDDSYGNAPILNALFVVKSGAIDGVLPLN